MSEIDDILKAMLSDNKNDNATSEETSGTENEEKFTTDTDSCLLYTSDAADD